MSPFRPPETRAVCLHVCVSRMPVTVTVNAAKPLTDSWDFVFLGDPHWEETPILFVLAQSWISLRKSQWNFSSR